MYRLLVDRLQGNCPVATPAKHSVPLHERDERDAERQAAADRERGGLDDAPDQQRGACGERHEAQIRKAIELRRPRLRLGAERLSAAGVDRLGSFDVARHARGLYPGQADRLMACQVQPST